jgi:hypothetical protein
MCDKRKAVEQEQHQIIVNKLRQRLELVEQLNATKDMLLAASVASVASLVVVLAVTYVLKRDRPAVNPKRATPNSRGATLVQQPQERQFPVLQGELLANAHVTGLLFRSLLCARSSIICTLTSTCAI